LLLSTVFFWAGDLIGGAYALSMPFYFSFLLPVFIFSLIAFAGNAARHAKSSLENLVFVLCATAAVAGPMILKAQLTWPWPITFSFCAVAVLVCSAYFFRRAFQQISFIFCLLLVSLLTLATGFFSQFLADVRVQNSKDHKIPALAVKLKQMLPPASEGDAIKFWYPESENNELKMLQSFFLHTFSMLPGHAGFPKYPQISPEDAEAVRRAGVQQVVLLDRDSSRMDSAIQAMGAAGLNLSPLQAQELRLGREKIYFKRLKLDFSEAMFFQPVDVSSLEPSSDASLALDEGKFFLTTAGKRWNFDVLFNFGNQNNDKFLTFNGRVYKGRVEVCLFADNDKVVSSIEIWPTDKPVSRTLYAGEERKAKALMIRNKMPDSSKSMVEISGIAIGDHTLDGN